MASYPIHQCECEKCQARPAGAEAELHKKMNLLLSRLDEQQRRWYAAVESKRVGFGGERLVSLITGLDEKTIRRGRVELEEECSQRPTERIRQPGGGRPLAEKKPQA
jgi:hypothetical protein